MGKTERLNGFWQSYRSSLLMLGGIVTGGCLGWFCPSLVPWLRPIGNVFLNLMFVLIVPLVFLSMSTAICRLNGRRTAGSVLGRSIMVFIGMSLSAALVAYIGCRMYSPMDAMVDSAWVQPDDNKRDIGALIVSTLTVPEFYMLLDKSHLLPLLIMAILTGFAVSRAGDKGQGMVTWLEGANEVVMQLVELIMLAAPIGLGCYFAGIMSDIGAGLVAGYMRALLLYMVLTLVMYVVVNPLWVWFRWGKEALVGYIRHIGKPSLMAIATCSSSACMPVAIQAAKQMGADEHVSEAVVPLGTNIFKEGSIMVCVIKIVFVLLLTGTPITGWGTGILIIALAILAACVVSAVPSGGMTGELFICALLGVNPELVGVLLVVATILDAPATLLNVVGYVTAALAVKK